MSGVQISPSLPFKKMKKISLKNKKVFVAGHTGLVGQSLCKRLEKENCKILYINKKSLDLRDFNKTDKWFFVSHYSCPGGLAYFGTKYQHGKNRMPLGNDARRMNIY